MFDFRLLERRLEEKRREREELRYEVLERTFKALEILSERYYFKKAYIFGSLVNPGRFHEWSDVDVAFIGLKDEDFFRIMADLSELIGRDVDVVQMERCRFSDLIEKEGIVWRGKSSGWK